MVGSALYNDSGLTCASNMLSPGREVHAEWPGTLLAYRVRCYAGEGVLKASCA